MQAVKPQPPSTQLAQTRDEMKREEEGTADSRTQKTHNRRPSAVRQALVIICNVGVRERGCEGEMKQLIDCTQTHTVFRQTLLTVGERGGEEKPADSTTQQTTDTIHTHTHTHTQTAGLMLYIMCEEGRGKKGRERREI